MAAHPSGQSQEILGCSMKTFRRFLADETAIEYGLIATGVALAIISAVDGVGTKPSAKFASVSTSLR